MFLGGYGIVDMAGWIWDSGYGGVDMYKILGKADMQGIRYAKGKKNPLPIGRGQSLSVLG
jgi:hypothetical protein